MKISELLNEAPAPGTEKPTSLLGKGFAWAASKKQDFDISRSVQKAYGFWITHVQRMISSGYDMENPDNYLKELSRWMRVRMHIPANSKILTDMITYLKTNGTTNQTLPKAMYDAVKAASVSTERGKRYSTRSTDNMKTLVSQILPIIQPVMTGLNVKQREELFNFIMAKIVADNTIDDPREILKLAQDYVRTLSSRPPPTSIPGGTTQTAGGVEYVWNGSEWKNSTTGATATSAISAALTASFAGRS